MRCFSRVVALLLALGVIGAMPLRAQQPRKVLTAEDVRSAIDDGVVFLRHKQLADGSWPIEFRWQPFGGGVTALCTLALLNCGVPPSDPMIERALTNLRKLDSNHTYVVALQTMVFCIAEPEKDKLLIRKNVAYLESIQKREGTAGTWAYGNPKDGNLASQGDNSNAQFALLALHEAERVGVKTSRETWKLARDHWQNTQNGDGSWGYLPGNMGTGSMTSAGIASLIMANEKLDPGDARVEGDQVICCGQQTDNTYVERAFRWLGDPQRFAVSSNPGSLQHNLYYLYGLERVGRMTNRRLIGSHDWYREGAELLVFRGQAKLAGSREHGYWKGVGQGEDQPIIGTSLALLFLAKGRRPVLAHKLAFGPGEHWNHHRQDLANLVHYCERQWKRELTWQVIESNRATSDDLNQAPVLFLSGSDLPTFTDAEAQTVRRYLDLGGFVFAEAACASPSFDEGFRKFMARVFPEPDEQGRPLYALRPLPPDHAVWTAEEPVDPNFLRQPLYGINVGCRTSVVYYPDNLGCYWDVDRIGRDAYSKAVEDEIRAARAIGINVMAYATNREVKYKLDIPPIATDQGPTDVIERAKLYVAEVKHSGGAGVAPAALVNLMKQLALDTGLRVSTEKRELALTQDTLFDYHLVFMHGRQSFNLSEAERTHLRTYIERGGLLFADAVCSSPEFAESFRREMTAIFPETALRPIAPEHAMFTEKFGGFDVTTVTLRDPRRSDGAAPLRADVLRTAPELEGLQLGERYGVIFSRYDLSCALERQNSLECTGYVRDDAAKIGMNVILFSLRGNL